MSNWFTQGSPQSYFTQEQVETINKDAQKEFNAQFGDDVDGPNSEKAEYNRLLCNGNGENHTENQENNQQIQPVFAKKQPKNEYSLEPKEKPDDKKLEDENSEEPNNDNSDKEESNNDKFEKEESQIKEQIYNHEEPEKVVADDEIFTLETSSLKVSEAPAYLIHLHGCWEGFYANFDYQTQFRDLKDFQAKYHDEEIQIKCSRLRYPTFPLATKILSPSDKKKRYVCNVCFFFTLDLTTFKNHYIHRHPNHFTKCNKSLKCNFQASPTEIHQFYAKYSRAYNTVLTKIDSLYAEKQSENPEQLDSTWSNEAMENLSLTINGLIQNWCSKEKNSVPDFNAEKDNGLTENEFMTSKNSRYNWIKCFYRANCTTQKNRYMNGDAFLRECNLPFLHYELKDDANAVMPPTQIDSEINNQLLSLLVESSQVINNLQERLQCNPQILLGVSIDDQTFDVGAKLKSQVPSCIEAFDKITKNHVFRKIAQSGKKVQIKPHDYINLANSITLDSREKSLIAREEAILKKELKQKSQEAKEAIIAGTGSRRKTKAQNKKSSKK